MSDLPNSLPDTLEELYTLMAACIQAGYDIAAEEVFIVRTHWPTLCWQKAEDRLNDVLAPYNNLTRKPMPSPNDCTSCGGEATVITSCCKCGVYQ